MPFPPEPDVPATQRGAAAARIRYEDVAQDGRILLTALPHFLGVTLWQERLVHEPAVRAAARAGIMPILTRLVIESGAGPISVRKPVEATGCYQLAHTVGDGGAVNRILLNMWVSMRAPRARRHGHGGDAGSGDPVPVGRVFGEHVFTRLFAPPDQRKVLELAFPGLDADPVPPARYAWRGQEELLALPAGARPLDDALLADEAPLTFGLAHTDTNQHVNSLVYPRLFEEAALRRLVARGKSPRVLGSFVDVAYRKPCFAGDRVRILLRCYELDGGFGAAGVFTPVGSDRPSATVHLRLG